MCWYDGPGNRQVVKPEDWLASIFAEVQKFYMSNQSPTRLTNLKLSMFVTTDKPHKFHPFLNCKGAECKHLLPALEWVCRRSLHGRAGKHHETHMVEALAALSELVALFDIAGYVLSEPQFALAKVLRDNFFTAYDKLHNWALSVESMSFHIVPKFHMFFWLKTPGI